MFYFHQEFVHVVQFLVEHVHFDRFAFHLFNLFEHFQLMLRFRSLVLSVVVYFSKQVRGSAHVGERHFARWFTSGDVNAALSSLVDAALSSCQRFLGVLGGGGMVETRFSRVGFGNTARGIRVHIVFVVFVVFLRNAPPHLLLLVLLKPRVVRIVVLAERLDEVIHQLPRPQ